MDRQQGRGCRKSGTLLYVYVDSDLLRAHANSDANSSLAYRPHSSTVFSAPVFLLVADCLGGDKPL